MWNPRVRLSVAAAVWLLVSLIPLSLPLLARALLGFSAGGVWFAGDVLWRLRGTDAADTRLHAGADDPGRRLDDTVVIVAGLLCLVGVGGLIVFGDDAATERWSGIIALVAVATGWVCVHTVYALRYARLYYSGDRASSSRRPIDFNQDDDPRYTDFLYFAFNLGMTYQVSDTNVQSSEVRGVVLAHCLQSWAFGTVVIASAINLVVGLGSG